MPEEKMPWQILRERLETSGLTMAELCRRLGAQPNYEALKAFVNGYRLPNDHDRVRVNAELDKAIAERNAKQNCN